MCPSSPLPSLAKSFPPASALFMLQSLQHGSHPPRNFYLVAVYFASALQLMYESACSLGLLLSLISPSLSSPQRKHLCSVSIIRLGSALVAYLLVTLTDGLSVVLSFTSYMLLGTPSNPLAPRWMMHHNVKSQTAFRAHWTESVRTPSQSQQLVSAELLLDPSSTASISTPSMRTSVSTSNRESSCPVLVCFKVLIDVVIVYIS